MCYKYKVSAKVSDKSTQNRPTLKYHLIDERTDKKSYIEALQQKSLSICRIDTISATTHQTYPIYEHIKR